MVYNIKKEKPELEIIINGGITKIEEIKNHLKFCDGVMIGRAIYQNPYFLVNIEKEIFNQKNTPTRENIAERLLKYVENARPNNDPTNAVYIHNLLVAISLIISHIISSPDFYIVYDK